MTRFKVLLIALVLLSSVAGCNDTPPAKKPDLEPAPQPKARPY